MKKLLLYLLFLVPALARAQGYVNLEAGVVRNPYNRVAIPGDTGTSFDLSKATDESYLYHRLSLVKRWDRQGVRLLYAPLSLSGSATYSKDIRFQGQTFARSQKIDATYEFNSYRATYFYQVDDDGPWQTRIGFTAKIRDAKIKLSQGSLSKTRSDTGLVPLFYLYSEYQLNPSFRLALDFDGLAAPQGRAIDAAFMAGARVSKSVLVDLGYRILEGGADNDKVYTFATLQYVFAALTVSF